MNWLSTMLFIYYLLGRLAQLVEQLTLNQFVKGSDPYRPPKKLFVNLMFKL